MAKRKLRNSTELLFETIFDAMHDKKAEDILLLDLSEIKGTNFDYFVITHGNSTTQVNAIAEEVRRKVKTVCHQNPAHSEGFSNAEWILLDYIDVVIHIFQKDVRDYFQLENLWADAVITPIVEEIPVKKTPSAKKTTTAKTPAKTGTTKKTTKKETTKEPVKKTAKTHERKSTSTAPTSASTPKSKTKPKSAASAKTTKV